MVSTIEKWHHDGTCPAEQWRHSGSEVRQLSDQDGHWSDEAWARRAYDAAVVLDIKKKDIVYHGVRQRLVDGDRKSTRRQVREIERQVKEFEMAGEEGNDSL